MPNENYHSNSYCCHIDYFFSFVRSPESHTYLHNWDKNAFFQLYSNNNRNFETKIPNSFHILYPLSMVSRLSYKSIVCDETILYLCWFNSTSLITHHHRKTMRLNVLQRAARMQKRKKIWNKAEKKHTQEKTIKQTWDSRSCFLWSEYMSGYCWVQLKWQLLTKPPTQKHKMFNHPCTSARDGFARSPACVVVRTIIVLFFARLLACSMIKLIH